MTRQNIKDPKYFIYDCQNNEWRIRNHIAYDYRNSVDDKDRFILLFCCFGVVCGLIGIVGAMI